MNVFISWAGNDREVKNVITAKLREEQIEYFDSDEFCQTDFSQECIKNIRLSSVFIVIVSDASMDPKSYVFNEVVEARRLEGEGRLNILVYKITDSPYTERFAFNLNHISDANHISRTQRNSGVSGIDTLIKRTKSLLQCRLNGNPEKPYDINTPKLVGSTVSYTKYFVEGSRDTTLTEIENAFSRSNIIILSEIFGFGKKSVIKKYVQHHPETSAVEIQGMHASLFDFFLAELHFSNINELAFDKQDDKQIILKKFEFLKKLEATDMIIVSDIDVDDDVDEFICSLLGELKCRVVFITQNSADAYADIYPIITVGKMSNQHLLELFFHYYKCSGDQEKQLLIPHLERFFNDIGGHTKTIELTASVLHKELRATPEQVIAHLSSNFDVSREFKDKIFNTLCGLLSLENFTDNEKKTLLLISLMANPIINEKKLHSLMNDCDIFDFCVISMLDDHRWITYNALDKSIYIEPIIAQICVRNFSDTEKDVRNVCFEYFQNSWNSKDFFISSVREQGLFIAQMENFFSHLKLTAISDMIREIRIQAVSNVKDLDKIQIVCQAFSSRYATVFENDTNCEDDCDNDFETSAAQWAYSSFFVILKNVKNVPMLYTFATSNAASLDEIREFFLDEDVANNISEMADIIGQKDLCKIFENAYDNLGADVVDCLAVFLILSVYYAFLKKDFETVQKRSEELWTLLQDSPQLLADPNICHLIVMLVKFLHIAFMQSNLYQPGAAFYEKILLIDWPDDIKYRMLLQYCDILFSISNDEALALDILTTTGEIFEDAMAKRNASEIECADAKLEFEIYYLKALENAGDINAAIEKYNEIKDSDRLSIYAANIISLINSIADKLIAIDIDKAVAFISENKDIILKHMESANISDDTKEDLERLLLIPDMYSPESHDVFSAGGIITDENYYQKYAKDKKNNILLMMSYNRIADKVKRYDFSSYTDEELAEHSRELFHRANTGESKANIMPEAFALVSEAGFRALGYRHHQVQYIGAAAMLDGKIAEILNGEGKTYTITLVAYVNSLYSSKTVVVDSSKYLTKRNYNWMKKIYQLLGVEVGYMPSGHDRSAFFEESTLRIIYTDLSSLAFSILFNEQSATEKYIDISLFSVIVDEADNTLVEHAKHSFTVTGKYNNTVEYAKKCLIAYNVACKINGNKQFYETNKYGKVFLTREVRPLIEDSFKVDYDNLAQVNEIKRLEESVSLALYCLSLVKDKDYFIKNGTISLENTVTGALHDPTNKEMGLFLCLANRLPKEIYNTYISNLCQKPSVANTTYIYGIFSRLKKLCGTSATVCSFKKEFKDIYNLDVVAIPTALPVRRTDQTVGLYIYRDAKNAGIIDMISEKHKLGQPILLIVEDIKESAEFSNMLDSHGIDHILINGLNAEKSPEIFANAGVFGSVVVATQIANRGIDIKLGGDAQRMTVFELVENGVDISDIDQILYGLPTPEIKAGELYRKYIAALERNKAIVAANKKRVIEVGGLCVITTTAYSDMRVEQQIRGRAGRQGDVGESYVFISMEDDVFLEIFSKYNNSSFFQNFAKELEIIDTPVLKRSIESFKQTVHHKTFSAMKNAANLCRRIDQSKNEILRLKYGLSDGSISFEEIIKIWCQDEDNIRSMCEIEKGNVDNATESVAHILKCCPSSLEDIEAKNAKDKLFEIAKRYFSECVFSEDTKKFLFNHEVSTLLSLHLTEMHDMEEAYSSISIKNSNKFFEDIYAKNLAKQMSEAIGRWLIMLQKK